MEFLLLNNLITLPDASTTLANIGAYSDPLFQQLLPLAYIFIAVAVVVVLFRLIAGWGK